MDAGSANSNRGSTNSVLTKIAKAILPIALYVIATMYVVHNFTTDGDDTATTTDNEGENGDVDFCTKLWSIVANMCCGACCQCWCQCCGMCATAQEYRELKRVLPP